MFLHNQEIEQQEKYYELLQIVGGLSNLFSDSDVPYLYYRAAENVFCKAFEADNLSRSDCSADASKDFMGIGLKTFLNNNGKSYQKVAEFNKDRALYTIEGKIDVDNLITNVTDLRNKRIMSTQRIHNIEDMIYHCVVREENQFKIFEEKMDLIDLNSIKNIKNKNNVVTFEDKSHEYNFNISKSTLLKRFNTPLDSQIVKIEIIKDPFDLLDKMFKKYMLDKSLLEKETIKHEFIILPLYSKKGKVEEKSGLNQWNAGGRVRNPDEIYIGIPVFIHKMFPQFFPPIDEPFDLMLPNKKVISTKVCQTSFVDIDGVKVNKGKAIMSNPNTALGQWLLRDVLKIPYGQVVTLSDLHDIGIDSIELRKIDNKNYEIYFKKQGTFEEFMEEKNQIISE